jgi:hypothetical protein
MRKMFTSTLEGRAKAAYKNGRLDYWAGAPLDPTTPLRVYTDLSAAQQAVIKQAWVQGWTDAYLMELPA